MTPADVLSGAARWCVTEGDCIPWLASLPPASVDVVVCDPPYAEVDRDYGRLSESEWEGFAHAMVRASLRTLKPRGSAVFIVQPNSERVGRMRAWVFRFLAWCAEELPRETGGRIGMVQDAWWWNTAAMPTVHCNRDRGLMRGSIKPCVWIGPEDCYRDQGDVLWKESDANTASRAAGRVKFEHYPSGYTVRRERITLADRGGVTPMNLLPFANTDSASSAGAEGHGAGTPYNLAAWWVRYLCPRGGVVCDPCAGTMTMGIAAVRQGRRFLGCEREAHHYAAGIERMRSLDMNTSDPVLATAADYGPLFRGAP